MHWEIGASFRSGGDPLERDGMGLYGHVLLLGRAVAKVKARTAMVA